MNYNKIQLNSNIFELTTNKVNTLLEELLLEKLEDNRARFFYPSDKSLYETMLICIRAMPHIDRTHVDSNFDGHLRNKKFLTLVLECDEHWFGDESECGGFYLLLNDYYITKKWDSDKLKESSTKLEKGMLFVIDSTIHHWLINDNEKPFVAIQWGFHVNQLNEITNFIKELPDIYLIKIRM